jgi:hypothetical protein
VREEHITSATVTVGHLRKRKTPNFTRRFIKLTAVAAATVGMQRQL